MPYLCVNCKKWAPAYRCPICGSSTQNMSFGSGFPFDKLSAEDKEKLAVDTANSILEARNRMKQAEQQRLIEQQKERELVAKMAEKYKGKDLNEVYDYAMRLERAGNDKEALTTFDYLYEQGYAPANFEIATLKARASYQKGLSEGVRLNVRTSPVFDYTFVKRIISYLDSVRYTDPNRYINFLKKISDFRYGDFYADIYFKYENDILRLREDKYEIEQLNYWIEKSRNQDIVAKATKTRDAKYKKKLFSKEWVRK